MAEQSVTLNPGESKVVSFEATPTEARTYQVSVNGLTGSFTAIAPKKPATFIFVSDARVGRWPEAWWSPNAIVEVDIQNIGDQPGVCSAECYFDVSVYGNNYATMGSKTIQPGQTVTFQGKWQWPGSMEEYDWIFWDGGYVFSSQIGSSVSYKFGRKIYPVGLSVSEIPAGKAVTVQAVLHLPGGRKWGPTSYEGFTGYGGDIFDVYFPIIKKKIRLDALYPQTTFTYPSGNQGTVKRGDMLLDGEKDYTLEFTLGPLSKGTYDIYAEVEWTTQFDGYGDDHHRPVGKYRVGQVKVV